MEKLKIEVTEKREIEIELPYYSRYFNSYYAVITPDGCIKVNVNDLSIIRLPVVCVCGEGNEKCDKSEFDIAYLQVTEKLNKLCNYIEKL